MSSQEIARLMQENAELTALLRLSAKIIGKVVSEDLMPDMVLPSVVLESIKQVTKGAKP